MIDILANKNHVLEIGSGTGQHATYFAQNLPNLIWQTSDLSINHSGINLWIDELKLPNLKRPVVVDLAHKSTDNIKSPETFDAIYTANTLHIISWTLVQSFFDLAQEKLCSEGTLCLYGPFNYQGKYTSESNAGFDLWLKDRDTLSGIRDFEAICELAIKSGLLFIEDIEMPANNRLLVFKKRK